MGSFFQLCLTKEKQGSFTGFFGSPGVILSDNSPNLFQHNRVMQNDTGTSVCGYGI